MKQKEIKRAKERQRESERERERDRERERQRERKTKKKRDKERDKERERNKERQKDRVRKDYINCQQCSVYSLKLKACVEYIIHVHVHTAVRFLQKRKHIHA